MAHFAKINEVNIVTEVVVINNDVLEQNNEEASGIAFLNELYGETFNWKQTSYNGNIRKNFAGIGSYYDKDWDVFIPPQTFPSWKLNYETFQWVPPTPKPEDTEEYFWRWSEINKEWIKLPSN